ncbi:GNAT family N-acetyltransferase [Halorussus halophilus]|uniref:GNAT family N-acetyltransferase n=1 Tax=Halorussus halophilus TaxID=2650975 RepID=UPI0013018674|nr:N-acetyltransferase [Halorussus halophilus]
MQIRDATPDDADAIQHVAVRSCRAAYADLVDDPALMDAVEDERFADDLRTWLAGLDDTVAYLVALHGDDDPDHDASVVGFAQFLWDDPTLESYVEPGDALLQSLYVDPDHWAEGVGTELLDAGLDRLPASVETVKLGVLSNNERAKRFYANRGFETVGESVFEVAETRYPIDVCARRVTESD